MKGFKPVATGGGSRISRRIWITGKGKELGAMRLVGRPVQKTDIQLSKTLDFGSQCPKWKSGQNQQEVGDRQRGHCHVGDTPSPANQQTGSQHLPASSAFSYLLPYPTPSPMPASIHRMDALKHGPVSFPASACCQGPSLPIFRPIHSTFVRHLFEFSTRC